jgi:hypothetical protein
MKIKYTPETPYVVENCSHFPYDIVTAFRQRPDASGKMIIEARTHDRAQWRELRKPEIELLVEILARRFQYWLETSTEFYK